MRIVAQNRVAILLHEGIRGTHGKTGLAYLRYGGATVVAAIDAQCAGESLAALTGIEKDIPIVANVTEALPYNPDVLLIGIAPSGGALPDAWWEEVKGAIAAGLSLANGLHTPMANRFRQLREGQWIWDIRQEPKELHIGQGKARSLTCKRILTVGTDMAIGKMSTSIELNRAAQKRGIKSKFLATGQGGLTIAGDGIALDAVRVDFAAGAVEQMVLDWEDEHEVLFIEGQGSLLHPGSTATLPLLRGSQPTGLVLVHRAGQKHIRDLPDILIPPLTEVAKLYEMVASAAGVFGQVKVKAIALNTSHLDAEAAQEAIERVRQDTGLPCTDVVRFGADSLLDRVLV
ncbi:hypothetical protein Ple7327_0846 [Pleurocapsa sp. PCC 7327]|uniref:DUF1611 domain-containing protein n=1 Tax=Pleurocapsa sp. PCC 7327 TaxID=118163 RepID=UPI00029FEA5A|nr:DUF1611 domain-containing protein [Pleurocapsa sp. PCC 7327]AFY76275.1 hypothetical protein Ple7327_0846 [Pleurocapsa sp. PCC 7327]